MAVSEVQTRALVHVVGPWELEYAAKKRQVWVQRCLRCDLLVIERPTRKGETEAPSEVGYMVGLAIMETGDGKLREPAGSYDPCHSSD